MKYLRKCCTLTNFKKYSIGLPMWESHDSFKDTAHKNLLRNAYEPYSACYIYSVKILKKIGGFDTTIINHGTEERELQQRLLANGIETIYAHILFPKAYVVHYSHDNLSRGVGRSDKERNHIMSKNGATIPFKSELYVVETYCGSTATSSIDSIATSTHKSKSVIHNNRVLFIIGNGPSLKSVNMSDLEDYDTFGLNSAYRKYPEIGYPTYHGCFDYVVCESHAEQFSKLILGSPDKMKGFFYLEPKYFSRRIIKHPKFRYINFRDKKINTISKGFNDFHDMGSSGANAVQCGILMGYNKIILLGCDCNYVDMVEGSEKLPDGKLTIKELPTKNPNYWFDDYQQVGDKYNLPQGGTLQIQSWERLAKCVKDLDIEIINCSMESKITCFKKQSLADVLDSLSNVQHI